MRDLCQQVLDFILAHPKCSLPRICEELHKPVLQVEHCVDCLRRSAKVHQVEPGKWEARRIKADMVEVKPELIVEKRRVGRPRGLPAAAINLKPGEKWCPRGRHARPLEEFDRSGYCKPCHRRYRRQQQTRKLNAGIPIAQAERSINLRYVAGQA